MKSKRKVQNLLERASQLSYSLETVVRDRKASEKYVIEKLSVLNGLIKTAEASVNLEHES